MRFKLFEGILGNLRGENKLLKFVVVVIGCVELWNSHKIDEAMKYQRTILVPAGLDRKVTITGDRASEEYIRIFARTVSSLAFNYSSATARGQFGELLQYFTADTFPVAKAAFYSMADTIERTRVSSSFVISKSIDIDSAKQTISVTGIQRQWVESNFIDTSEKTYMISFKLVDGRFAVTAITEKLVGLGAGRNASPPVAKDAAKPAVNGGAK